MGLQDRGYHKEHIRRIERSAKRRRLFTFSMSDDRMRWVPFIVAAVTCLVLMVIYRDTFFR